MSMATIRRTRTAGSRHSARTRSPQLESAEELLATPHNQGEVARFELLAHDMPSLLTRLRPMGSSADGMLRYLFGKNPAPSESSDD